MTVLRPSEHKRSRSLSKIEQAYFTSSVAEVKYSRRNFELLQVPQWPPQMPLPLLVPTLCL